jgi:hypothetical protein
MFRKECFFQVASMAISNAPALSMPFLLATSSIIIVFVKDLGKYIFFLLAPLACGSLIDHFSLLLELHIFVV